MKNLPLRFDVYSVMSNLRGIDFFFSIVVAFPQYLNFNRYFFIRIYQFKSMCKVGAGLVGQPTTTRKFIAPSKPFPAAAVREFILL